MNAGTLLEIGADVVNMMKTQGIIDPAGNFVEPSLDKIPELAAAIEAILKSHGVQTPDKLDKMIQLVPLVLAIAK